MKNLTLLDKISREYSKAVKSIESLPGCKYVTALPDAGMSNHETPYGIAAGFDEYVVPQLVGRIIGCGMGLIHLDVRLSEIQGSEHELIKNLALHINRNKRKYYINNELLDSIYREGPQAILKIVPDLEFKTERTLFCPIHLFPYLYQIQDINKIIPNKTLGNIKLFSLPGQSIHKNHFIEFSQPLFNASANNSTEKKGIYCAFHLESAVSSKINGMYSGTRKKERSNGALKNPITWIKFLQKAGFHLKAEGISRFRQNSSYFLRHVDFTPIPIDSLSGQRYLSSVLLQTNVERVSRLLFSVILIEAIEKTLKRTIDWKLVFEGTHNTFEVDDCFGEDQLVSRKNLVRADSSKLGFMAGMYDIPSFLVEPKRNKKSKRWANSYDHGIGHHLWRESDQNQLNQAIHKKASKNVDISNFEAMWMKSNQYESSKYHESNLCSVYRVNLTTNQIESKKHAIKTGAVVDYVLKAYSQTDCPVKIIGLLNPFLNYKENR